jgi:hypothetical protein
VAQFLGLCGMPGQKQQLGEPLDRPDRVGVPRDELLKGASLALGVSGPARKPGAKAEHLIRCQTVSRQMGQRALGFDLVFGCS